MNESMNE